MNLFIREKTEGKRASNKNKKKLIKFEINQQQRTCVWIRHRNRTKRFMKTKTKNVKFSNSLTLSALSK
jgi:hypothetical protein